ncbi:NTP pyrophosphohydrolase [Oleiphilus messinensis]|uniref:ADP-ribose pyrophosphatase n=1 Tax=Oleiphilus messinensis TaxID=141451 RepID=A0A1Y0I627_9GAMM|nr:ADP-ribose diphosphatase [Oleiphilus messinensis]ARU54853.1 NTP pyrophosphohydrolase [Oleiphilus messinensis]
MTGEKTSVPEQQFGHDDFEETGREPGYQGFFRVDKVTIRHRLFKGGWSPELHREVFVRGNATCALPYDPDTDKVILLEQFRIGALENDASPWLLELIAGMNEIGESSEDVVRREGVEEAGLTLEQLYPVCSYFVSPGGTSEKIDIFCAKVSASAAGGIHGLEAEGEDIKVHVVDREVAYGMVESGLINNAAAIIALQWLQMNHEKLAAQWAR